MRIAEPGRELHHEHQLDPAIPHLDQGLFLRVCSHQVRLREDILEISTNRPAFGDLGPIIQHQRRHLRKRRDLAIFLRPVLLFHDGDFFQIHRVQLAFRAQEKDNPVRIGGHGAMIEFHRFPPRMFFSCPASHSEVRQGSSVHCQRRDLPGRHIFRLSDSARSGTTRPSR